MSNANLHSQNQNKVSNTSYTNNTYKIYSYSKCKCMDEHCVQFSDIDFNKNSSMLSYVTTILLLTNKKDDAFTGILYRRSKETLRLCR